MTETAKSLPEIPGYELIDRLGGGGQASVYRAVQTSMNRPVAVKVIPEGHPDHAAEVGRFLREARLLAKLRHDNIVRAIDFGEHEGVRYLVMEFIEGTAVNDLLRREGHLDVVRSLDIAIQVCRALDHAAGFDVIHRDIKPANIVLNEEGRAIVVDFGLARPEDIEVEVTRAGISMGTPHYMAPEQIQGEEKLDPRVDLYALGGTLFHMLTGKVPFPAPRKMQMLMRHLKDPLEVPADLPQEIPPRVLDIVRRAMEKDRDRRYRTARAMLSDLEAARATLGPGGPPATGPERSDGGANDASEDELSRENEQLRREAEEIRRQTARMLEEKALALEAAEARAAALTARLEEIEQRKAKREGEPGIDPATVAALARERDELRERLASAREAVDRIAGKAHEEKERLAARANELDRELRALRREREDLDRRLRAVEDERRRAEESAEAAERRSEEVSEETRHLRLARDELAEQLKALESEVQLVRAPPDAKGEERLPAALAALRKERAELARRVAAVELELEEARNETRTVSASAVALEDELAGLKAERDELARRIAEAPGAPGKVEDLSRALSEQERRAVDATAALAEEKQRARTERSAIEEECEKLREQLAAARTEVDAAEERARRLKLQTQEARREAERVRNDAESRVQGLMAERDAYAAKVRELASRVEREAEGAPVYAAVETEGEIPVPEAGAPPMVRIPEGFFIAGEDEGREVEKPRRRVRLHAFDIDVYPVTNRQYLRFVRAGGVQPPDHWDGDAPAEDILDHPVVRVTWQEAVAYASWCGKRLPTLLEWQRAARGADGRSFPWGEHEDVTRLNSKEAAIGGTTPVGSYPEGVSPDGVHDMAGNVTEWVYGRFTTPAGTDADVVIRPVCGGSWRDAITRSRCAARRGYNDGMRAYYVGFRCARNVS